MPESFGNWIAPRNPWNLQAPPDWVLRQLAEYDRELVLMPGVAEPVYRLMRKSHAAQRLSALNRNSELAVALAHGLVPVTSILNSPNWFELFQWLRDHDIWAAGGPEAAEKQLLAAEQKASIDQAVQEVDDLDQRGTSAWFAKQLRAGEATFVQEGKQSTS